MLRRSLCSMCIHHKGDKKKRFCKAFPNGIPHEILYERVLHYNPVKNQLNTVVFESKNQKKDSNKNQIQSENYVKIRTEKETQVLDLLQKIVDKEGITNFKTVAFGLMYQNSSDFFWKEYRKLKIYIIGFDLQIKEIEIPILSEFVKVVYDLLETVNIHTHQSSIQVFLGENKENEINYSIESSESFLQKIPFDKDRIFLYQESDYEAIKNSKMYRFCKKKESSEMIKIIDHLIGKEVNLILVDPYKVFLLLYSRNILVTQTEAMIVLLDLRKQRK